MFGFGRKKEARASVTAAQSSEEVLRVFGLQDFLGNSAGEHVTVETALGVPAIWAAVNFLAGTIAGLPLAVYKKTKDGREKVSGGLADILHDVANEEDMISSFALRKWWMEQALTGGRGVVFIDRNAKREIVNLWPLDPMKLTIKRLNGKKRYDYRAAKQSSYQSSEVLDLPFMLKSDGLSHRSPLTTNREVIGLAQAITKYGAAYFRNGGVPPFAVTGNFQSSTAMKRAADDLDEAVVKASRETRQALVLPAGLEIKAIGGDPEKNQMVETQRFVIEQIARIFSLPPVFLQDLTHGNFSNTEQQDLHLVKHTVKRWVEQIEQEMNLKFFGRGSDQYVEFNLDGLLRGDFATRMTGYATGIQNGILTPDEARNLENRPNKPGGDALFIQGATVPLVSQTNQTGGTDDGA